MKRHTLSIVFFTLFAGALSVANAQQPAAGAARPTTGAAATPTTTTAAPASGAVLGVVYTELFRDPKNGIQRLVTAETGVEREYQPRITQLQGKQREIETATANLQKVAAVQDAAKTRAETERIESLKRDYERQAEDAQLDFNKRRGEVLAPLSENINTALQAFAKQRGISVLIDGSRLGGVMMVLNDGIDITNAFIADYNRRNPATAAAATPARP